MTVAPSDAKRILEEALREHHKLPFLSGALHTCRPLYVDTGHLDLLQDPTWQVVFGRSGTGKTFLLRTFTEQVALDLAKDHAAVYVRADELLVPSLIPNPTPEQFAFGFLHLLMERTRANLVQQIERASRDSRAGRRRTEQSIKYINASIANTLELVGVGRPIAGLRSPEASEEKHSSGQSGRGVFGRFRVGARDMPDVGLGIEASTAKQSASSESVRLSGPTAPRLAEVRDVLVELVRKLELERIYLVIDDWDSLPVAVQPYLANLMRAALWGVPEISVKMAGNKYECSFFTEGGDGLRFDEHIAELVNLDRAVLNDDELFGYFEDLLFRRLLFRGNGMSRLVTHELGVPLGFAELMFENRESFEHLIFQVEAVPQQFVLAVRHIARSSRYSLAAPWTRADIDRTVHERTVSGLGELLQLAAGDESLSRAIEFLTGACKAKVIENRSPTFLVNLKTQNANAMRTLMRPLVSRELAHEISAADLPAETRNGFLAYRVSRGVWLDWERALQQGGLEAPDYEEAAKVNEQNFSRYVMSE